VAIVVNEAPRKFGRSDSRPDSQRAPLDHGLSMPLEPRREAMIYGEVRGSYHGDGEAREVKAARAPAAARAAARCAVRRH